MTASYGKDYFEVACCGRRRGLINDVLVCSRCDFTEISVIPNEYLAKDVPEKVWFIQYYERES